MRVIYSHRAEDGRELRVEAATDAAEHPVVFIADAPGERAVSHPFTQPELDSLIANLNSLRSNMPVEADGA